MNNNALYDFMERVAEDPRISPAHISLFAAILCQQHLQEQVNPISVYSRDLMKLARIFSPGTYHRCIRDLKDYGYIDYVPSYNPVLGSLVYVKEKRLNS